MQRISHERQLIADLPGFVDIAARQQRPTFLGGIDTPKGLGQQRGVVLAQRLSLVIQCRQTGRSQPAPDGIQPRGRWVVLFACQCHKEAQIVQQGGRHVRFGLRLCGVLQQDP